MRICPGESVRIVPPCATRLLKQSVKNKVNFRGELEKKSPRMGLHVMMQFYSLEVANLQISIFG